MGADDGRAVRNGGEVSGDRSAEAVLRLRWRDPIDEALARCADQQRQSEPAQSVELGEHGDALLGRLAEADSRVEHDPVAADPGFAGDLERAMIRAMSGSC